jgi:hypothetical protein
MRIKSMETLVTALRADEAAALAALADGPVVVINGRSLRDREELGDVLRALVRNARASLTGKASEERLGQVGSLQLFLFSGREAEDVHLYLQGQAVHDCKAYQTGPALAAELISVLNGTVGRAADADHRLASMRQRLVDLREELTRPFEHEDRLTSLLARQRELARELDIDKDEVGSQAVEADEQALAA